MSVKLLRGRRGALLFEMFIALMILSVGIVKALSVFSQTLYAKQQNTAAEEVQAGYERLLFEWNAVPGARIVDGRLEPYQYGSEDGSRRYLYRMSVSTLPALARPKDVSEAVTAEQPREFHDVTVEVVDPRERRAGRFEALLFARGR